jgi:hypothetical protein
MILNEPVREENIDDYRRILGAYRREFFHFIRLKL